MKLYGAAILAMACVSLALVAAAAPVVQPASPIDRPIPAYPPKALGVEGYVKLQFTIDKTGHTKDVVPFDSSPPGLFDAAAVEALSHWTYHPRTEDGQAVDQHQNTIVLRFKANGDHPPIWLNQHPIYYPREAYLAKREGSVTVGYDIDEQGAVGNVHVVSSTPSGVFDDKAVEDVKNRVFSPMIVAGQPTADIGLTTVVEFKLADAKIAPKLLHLVEPKYPEVAAGYQGYIAVDMTVTPDGSVTDPKISVSYPAGVFDKAVLGAIAKWQFEPLQTLGGPAASRMYYAFIFRGQGTTHYLQKGQWVKLDYTLQTDGRARDIVVIGQSESDVPVKKAIEQLKNMRFAPVTQNGVPVEVPHQVLTIH
jgi:TonB family protein